MEDKILNIVAEQNLIITSVKTTLHLLKVAKEAGYNKVTVDLVGLENSPYQEPLDIDEAIKEQEDYLAYIYLGGLNKG